jgi:predicted transcriptional regulator
MPPMIQVPVGDYLKVNAALIRLLITLYECGGSLLTKKLYDSANMSYSHGTKTIGKAIREGLIKRDTVPKQPGKKGNHMKVSSLTPKGLKLLKALELYTPLPPN